MSREGATPETSLPRGKAQGENRVSGRKRCHYTLWINELRIRSDAARTHWQGNSDGLRDTWKKRAEWAILTIL